MRHPLAMALLLWLFLAPPGTARADEERGLPKDSQLVHLDTPAVLGRGLHAFRGDVRLFGGDEDLLYAGLALHYGFAEGLEGILRASFAERKQLGLPGGGAIGHGGNDIELLAKWQPRNVRNWAGLIGVSFPDTPAQGNAVLTLGATAATAAGSRVNLYFNPHALFLEDNAIVGLGVGAHVRVSDTITLVADFTPILTGENTRDTTTGARKRSDVYGVVLRFGSPNGRTTFDLGYGNGLGSTTGFGLTPGLGGSGAFYASVSWRR